MGNFDGDQLLAISLRSLVLTLLGCFALTVGSCRGAAARASSITVAPGRFVCVLSELRLGDAAELAFAHPELGFIRGALQHIEALEPAGSDRVQIFRAENASFCDIRKGDVLVTLKTTADQARDRYVVEVAAISKTGSYADKIVRKPAARSRLVDNSASYSDVARAMVVIHSAGKHWTRHSDPRR